MEKFIDNQYKTICEQDSIPVGCVPPVAVASTPGGRVSYPQTTYPWIPLDNLPPWIPYPWVPYSPWVPYPQLIYPLEGTWDLR